MRRSTKDDKFYKVVKKLYHVDSGQDILDLREYSFDKKTVYNFWRDIPDKLTPEQIDIFKRESPEMASLKGML